MIEKLSFNLVWDLMPIGLGLYAVSIMLMTTTLQ